MPLMELVNLLNLYTEAIHIYYTIYSINIQLNTLLIVVIKKAGKGNPALFSLQKIEARSR